jgi:GntR family transcriptional repressor for pyruvate dehydrogenase complex
VLTEPKARIWRKPPRLYEEIARDLADSIIKGDTAPTGFLPTEEELATKYRCSRNVIREAIKLLSARGMVEVLHGRGSRVLPRYRWRLLDQLVHLMREDRQVPKDLLELRRILEVEIAGLAAENATDEHMNALGETIDQMRLSADRPDICIEHDIQFHRLLAEAAGNQLLPLVLEPIGQLLRASRVATIHNPGTVDRSIAAHQDILDHTKEHDVTGARQAMRRHLLQVEGEIRLIKAEFDPTGAGGLAS